jgi:hypothetical protein
MPQSLPITINLGPGNEHESRSRMISQDSKSRCTRRPKRVYGDDKYNTQFVMMYLVSRSIAARITESKHAEEIDK